MFAVIAAVAAPTMPHAYAGVQGLLVSGVHRDCCVTQHGVGGGPLLQVRAGGSRLALHFEGIPVVSVPARPSAEYGQATPAVGVLHAAAEYALDARERLWIGIGESVYNQRTPLPALQQRVSSRLAGVRYVVRYREPLRSTHFLEGTLGVAPAIFGADRYVYTNGTRPPVNKDERASEVDASVALGVRSGSNEWLFGVRTLNFTAHFTATGISADRNSGSGVLVEWRRVIR